MSLLPRSLFSRLVLVLLSVLVAAQLLSFAIHMHDRRQMIEQASGMQSAQRIADMVRLLESMNAAERRRVAGVLSAPAMSVRLDGPALPSAAPGDAQDRARALLFSTFLRRSLGDEWPVEVALSEDRPFAATGKGFSAGPGKGPGWMQHHAGMAELAHGGISFVAQVRLRDGSFVTFDSRPPVESASWPYRLLASIAVLLAAVMVVSLVAVRWVTRPLNELAHAADALGRDINRPPMREEGPLEVVRAARAFNTMQARLVRYVQDRTRVLAAMSHDLKTPLTRLRLRAELLDDAPLRQKFVGDLAELESMVGATLDYLRGLEADEPAKPIDVKALLEALQQDLAALGPVTIEGTAERPFEGRPRALRRCLANLLENALRYGATAAVTLDDDEQRLEIRIRDQGPGIPESEIGNVFEPYYRVESSRSRQTGGTGLGLTIARHGAQLHGGRLTLRNHPQGGLEASLVLPRR